MVCPPTMTADTYSLELPKSELAISIVMFKVDWGSREEKTASHAGAVETDDLQERSKRTISLSISLYFPGEQEEHALAPATQRQANCGAYQSGGTLARQADKKSGCRSLDLAPSRVRSHSLSLTHTQYSSDCALFLSLALARSRARSHTLSLTLSLSQHSSDCTLFLSLARNTITLARTTHAHARHACSVTLGVRVCVCQGVSRARSLSRMCSLSRSLALNVLAVSRISLALCGAHALSLFLAVRCHTADASHRETHGHTFGRELASRATRARVA